MGLCGEGRASEALKEGLRSQVGLYGQALASGTRRSHP